MATMTLEQRVTRIENYLKTGSALVEEVEETPVADAPVADAPVADAPVADAPVADAPAAG